MSGAPRVAIIGARRHRQGLGPYVARALVQAGAEVPCFVGTSPSSVEQAREELAAIAGIEARGHVEAEALLDDGPLDAVAILSPAPTHRRWLEWALESGLSVLCEKPFVWGGADDLAATEDLVEGFAAAGLTLWENCQWPYTLGAYAELHPGSRGRTPGRFAMRLSPSVTGSQMIGDALPHALSLLQAVAPGTDAHVENVGFSCRDEAATDLVVTFSWVSRGATVSAEVRLAQEAHQPRQAGYALDDAWAWRVIRLADYAQFFTSGARLVDVEDPLHGLVADFVTTLSGTGRAAGAEWSEDPLSPDRRILQRMAALTAFARSWHG